MFSERVVRSVIDYLEFCFLFAALSPRAQTAAHSREAQTTHAHTLTLTQRRRSQKKRKRAPAA